jgi:hypothetical protein
VHCDGDDEGPPRRAIVLTLAAWAHICRRHPELAGYRREILLVVAAPSVVERDRRHRQRWRFYRAGLGPSRWLAVIVDFDFTDDPARIVTAHGFRKERPR